MKQVFKAENFASRLSDVLRTLDMSQRELAERADLTEAAVSQILSGKRDPSLATLCRILNVVPVKFESLVQGRK